MTNESEVINRIYLDEYAVPTPLKWDVFFTEIKGRRFYRTVYAETPEEAVFQAVRTDMDDSRYRKIDYRFTSVIPHHE